MALCKASCSLHGPPCPSSLEWYGEAAEGPQRAYDRHLSSSGHPEAQHRETSERTKRYPSYHLIAKPDL